MKRFPFDITSRTASSIPCNNIGVNAFDTGCDPERFDNEVDGSCEPKVFRAVALGPGNAGVTAD